MNYRLNLKYVAYVLAVVIASYVIMKDNVENIKQTYRIKHTNESLSLEGIKTLCGDLCNLEKPIVQGEYMGAVKADINCDAIFEIENRIGPPTGKPPRWNETSDVYKKYLLHNGKVEVNEWYFDEAGLGGAMDAPRVFSKEVIDSYGKVKLSIKLYDQINN